MNWLTTSAAPPVSSRLAVEAPVGVGEDAQPREPRREAVGLGLAVVAPDAQQDREARRRSRPTATPSTRTSARVTRWTTARMGAE